MTVPENDTPAETPVIENSQLRDRGNVADITALLQGESNANADEIDKRRSEGDAVLGDAPAKTNGAAPADSSAIEQADANAGIDADKIAAPETGKPKITSMKGLAEAAGIDIKQLYDLTLSFGDGSDVKEPVKLGAIKDAYQSGLDVDRKTADLKTATADFENKQIVENQAVQSLIASMSITPEQIQTQQQLILNNKQREQQKLFQAVPELAKNAELRQQRHTEIVELVKPYGISAAEIDNLADHRFYKFAMDAVNWRALIASASADAKRVRKTAKGKSTPTRKFDGKGTSTTATEALADKAKTTRMPGDQVAAISALLGE